MTNPYAGNEPYDTAWQQGYDYTSQMSSEGQPQTPDFSSWGYDDQTTAYIGQIWQEGALAGQQAAANASGAAPGSGSSAGQPSDGGAPPGGTDDGAVELPSDVADELANFASYYPETWAVAQATDPDAYVRESLGIDEPPTDDEPVA
jgi:hypothetical protein